MTLPEQGPAARQVVPDRISGIVLLAVGGAALYISSGYTASGRVFPMLAAAALVLCALGILGRSFTRSRQLDYDGPSLEWIGRMLGLLVLIFLYVLGVAHLGYTTSTLVFVPITAFVCGLRRLSWLFFGTIIYVAVSSAIFLRLFHTQFPPDLILRLF
jgi:hypothetical protein